MVISFEECLNYVKGKKHLMLGNGFSVALFPNIFNYRRLADNIESEQIKSLFKAIDTNDFEFVMRRLYEAQQIVTIYGTSPELETQLLEDIASLKSTLISVISKCHPDLPNSITEAQYLSCWKFLHHFNEGKKYTFNYDLLLYWVYMHFKDNKDLSLECDDGFRYDDVETDLAVFWEIGREIKQSLFYLHGAMHIFSDGSNIEKLSYNNVGTPLADQVRDSVDNDKFPVFISEGTTEHKLARIKKNGYLSRAFSSLKNIRGSLFIYGHSIRDEDDHVFDLINENKGLGDIFISLYGDLDLETNQAIIAKVDRWAKKYEFPKRKYHFYAAESAHVWDSE